MDEKQVLDRFQRQKIATIKQLEQWLNCSVMTVRRATQSMAQLHQYQSKRPLLHTAPGARL